MRCHLFLLFIFIANCSAQKEIRTIEVNTNRNAKECFSFLKKEDTLEFNRKIKIIKNSISDTIIIGHVVLPPKYTGTIDYTKLKKRDDLTVDLNYDNPPAKMICVHQYKSLTSKGKITFELIKSIRE